MTTVPFRWSNQSAVSSDHRHHQGNVLVGLRNTQTSQRPRWPWDRVTWSPVFPILKHNFVVVVLVVLEMLIFIYSFIYLFLLLSYMSLNAQTQDVDTKIQTNSCWNTEPYLLTCKDFPSLLAELWFVHLHASLFYFFLLPQQTSSLHSPPSTLYKSFYVWTCSCWFVCGCTPCWWARACHSVLLQARGRSSSFSRNTPRTNVPHLCTVQHSLSSIAGALH